MTEQKNVLRIDASGRWEGSTSRALTDDIVDALEERYGEIIVVTRDLTRSLPHVDQSWIAANLTDPAERDLEQQAALELSDSLVEELQRADVIVIGTPIYNFGVPAALKAWIDMVARARLTFRYTEQGPKGLLKDKKVYLAIASGGTAIDSPIDFATPYLRHVLGFIGITDVDVVSAGQQMSRGAEAIASARKQLNEVFNQVQTA